MGNTRYTYVNVGKGEGSVIRVVVSKSPVAYPYHLSRQCYVAKNLPLSAPLEMPVPLVTFFAEVKMYSFW